MSQKQSIKKFHGRDRNGCLIVVTVMEIEELFRARYAFEPNQFLETKQETETMVLEEVKKY